MSDASWVYTGTWTNWGQGSVRGKSITLTDAGGAYLIAFLALFVRLAGQHSWGIVCYIAFRLRQRRSKTESNAYHLASQSILRNTNIDISAAWQFSSFIWRHKLHKKGRVWRLVGWTIFALCHAVAFLAAGIFVSRVAESGSADVLIRGPVCGLWQDPKAFGLYSSGNKSDTLENISWNDWVILNILKASDFTRQCYNVTTSATVPAGCNAYAPKPIEWNLSTNKTCPFDPKICLPDHFVRLDSGYLDSQEHFGINANSKDRVKYRKVVECSPLVRDGYISNIQDLSQTNWPINAVAPPSNAEFQEFNYGTNVAYNTTSTFIWTNLTMFPPAVGEMSRGKYAVSSETYSPDLGQGTFIPVPELRRTDADTVIHFLVSIALYPEPVDDPWFLATDPLQASLSLAVNEKEQTYYFYKPNNNVSVMACAQQFQYCNHDRTRCTPLAGTNHGGRIRDTADNYSLMLNLNDKQRSTISRLFQASWLTDMYFATSGGRDGDLLASYQSGISTPLTFVMKNQWMLEMQHHFLLGITGMQMQLSQYATGPPHEQHYEYLTKPTAEEEWMCTNQIVQRLGYTTFSVLGLTIVVVLGVLAILINTLLPELHKRTSENAQAWGEYHHISRALRKLNDDSDSYIGEKQNQGSDDPTEHSSILESDERHHNLSQNRDAMVYVNNFTRNPASHENKTAYTNDFSINFDNNENTLQPSTKGMFVSYLEGRKTRSHGTIS